MALFHGREDVYCAFCKSQKKVYTKKHVSFSNYVETFVLSVLIMFIVWEGFEFRFLPIWLSLVLISEVLVQVRWRLALVCKRCGFDPIIYRRSHEDAAIKVKTFLENRKKDPSYWLSKDTNLDLPCRTPEGEIVPNPRSSKLLDFDM